jgi:hypothetical protein
MFGIPYQYTESRILKAPPDFCGANLGSSGISPGQLPYPGKRFFDI